MDIDVNDRKCSRCLWWQRWSDGDGECRRYPPAGTGKAFVTNGYALWPVTYRDRWCGEFKAKAK